MDSGEADGDALVLLMQGWHRFLLDRMLLMPKFLLKDDYRYLIVVFLYPVCDVIRNQLKTES